MTQNFYSIFFLGVLLLALDCQPDEERLKAIEKLKTEQAAAQVKIFGDKRMATCYRLAIERAGEIVDSILIANATSISLVDTIDKPNKPSRPTAPPAKVMNDTQAIAPLVNEEIDLEREYEIPVPTTQSPINEVPPIANEKIEPKITSPKTQQGTKINN